METAATKRNAPLRAVIPTQETLEILQHHLLNGLTSRRIPEVCSRALHATVRPGQKRSRFLTGRPCPRSDHGFAPARRHGPRFAFPQRVSPRNTATLPNPRLAALMHSDGARPLRAAPILPRLRPRSARNLGERIRRMNPLAGGAGPTEQGIGVDAEPPGAQSPARAGDPQMGQRTFRSLADVRGRHRGRFADRTRFPALERDRP